MEYLDDREFDRRTLLRAGAGASVALAGLGTLGGTAFGASGSDTAGIPYPATGSKDISGEITFWGWDPVKRCVGGAVPGFNKLFPNIKVKVEELGYGDIFDKLAVLFRAGSGAPDISWIDNYQIGRYIYTGDLVDVTDAMAPYRKRFAPTALTSATGPDGRFHAWPSDSGPAGLWYQEAVFEEHNIAVPKTWNEYLAAGKTLKKAGVHLLGFKSTGPSGPAEVSINLGQLGGSFFSAAGKPTVNTPKVLDSMSRVATLMKLGLVANTGAFEPLHTKLWKAGKIATYPEGAWMLAYWPGIVGTKPGEDTGIRLAPMPVLAPGGPNASHRGGSSIGITKQSKNQDAANVFARYLLTSRGGGAAYRDGGLIPAYLPALVDPRARGPLAAYGGQKVWATINELAKNAPGGEHDPAAWGEFNTAFTARWPAFYKSRNAKAYAAALQKDATAIAAKYP
jgi:ABC-type glycerol-3-phosphate transport system substrate-binding protein